MTILFMIGVYQNAYAIGVLGGGVKTKVCRSLGDSLLVSEQSLFISIVLRSPKATVKASDF